MSLPSLGLLTRELNTPRKMGCRNFALIARKNPKNANSELWHTMKQSVHGSVVLSLGYTLE